MIKCKEDLTGIKVKFKSRGNWEEIVRIFKMFGISQSPRKGTDMCMAKDWIVVPKDNLYEYMTVYDFWFQEGNPAFKNLKEVTFEDLQEAAQKMQETKDSESLSEDFTIPWDEASEGYDYWIVSTGAFLSSGSFHKKHGLTYEDVDGFYWEIGYEGYQYKVYTNPKIQLLKKVQEVLKPLREISEEPNAKNYKYVPVEVESIFDLRNMFEDGKLYFEDANQGDGQGMVQLPDEGTLIILLAGQDPIYVRQEVTWQDEVLTYLQEPSDEGFEEELPSKFRVDLMDKSFHLVDSEFLEMCRVALRATGELK